MVYSAGSAYVQLLPTVRGFGATAGQALTSELSNVGTPAGEGVGQRVSTGIASGMRRSMADVRAQFDQVSSAGSSAMSTLSTRAAPVLDTLSRFSPTLGRMRDGFRDSNAAASVFSGTAGTVGGALRTTLDHANNLGSGFVRMGQSAETAMSKVGGTVERAVTAPLRTARDALASYGIGAGTAFAGAGVAALAAGIQFDASQEQATMAFTNMMHSGQQATQFMSQLQTFAAHTPFDLPSVVTGAQRLMAFGFQAEQVIPTLTAIGDAVAGMGGSTDQINEVTLAIGQMTAKGKVQGDEILQLTEAGIPALQILANRMHLTTGELQDMITKGLVPSGPAVQNLIAGIEEGTDGAAGHTVAFAHMMDQQATTITGVWSNFRDNANKALGDLVRPALPVIKSSLGELTNALGTLPAFLDRIRQAGGPVWTVLGATFRDLSAFVTGSLVPSLRNLWTAIQPVIVIVGGALLAALRGAGALLRDVIGPVLVALTSWLRQLMPVIVGIATAFAAWYAIGAAVTVVTRAITLARTAILAVRTAWTLLSIAFTVSPIGFVIALVVGLVAGIIYAYTHFQWFRNVVAACWQGIVTAAQWAWGLLQTVWNGILVGLRAVGDFFVMIWHGIETALSAIGAAATWLWTTILRPVFDAIGLAVRVLIAIIVTVLVTPFVLAFQALAAIATWLWNVALKPVFDWIAAGAMWLWNNGIKPVIDLVVAYFRLWADVALWLWTNAIQPAFNWIGAAAQWLWTNAILPVVNFIVGGFQQLGAWATWLWQNAVLPAWNGIGAAVSWVWNVVLLPAFNAIKAAVGLVGDAFTWVWQRVIEPAWNALGAGVRWIWDNAISPAFEAIKGGVDAVGRAFDSAVQWISRVWDGIKSIAAKPVNFVVDWVYNKGIRTVWNFVAHLLGLGELAPAALIPEASGGGILPGFAPGVDDQLVLMSRGEAVLVPELVQAIGPGNIVAANYAASGRRQTLGRSAGHASGGGIARAAGGGVIDGILSFVEGIGDSVVSLFKDPVGWIKSKIGFPDSEWINLLAQVPANLIDKAADWLWDKLKNPLSWFGGSGDSGGGGSLDAWIAAAMAFAGVPATWSGPLHTLIMRESGGNPRAINNWDINAQRGDPSRGLMQTIGSTFAAYRDPRLPNDIFDPVANIVAGIRYIQARYGSIFNVQQAVGATPQGYDDGGWLPPGLSTVYNGTGRSEAVLTGDQWDALLGTTTGPYELTGDLYLDSGEFLGVVRGEISESQQAVGTQITRRTR